MRIISKRSFHFAGSFLILFFDMSMSKILRITATRVLAYKSIINNVYYYF